MDQDNVNGMPILRDSSIDEFLNAILSEEPFDFACRDREIANHELGMVQSSGVNHQVEFIVDAGTMASNTSNGGYCGYNNGGDLILDHLTSQVEFGIQQASLDVTQAPILQSQSFVDNCDELIASDVSIPNIGSEGCIAEDSHDLPTYAHSDVGNDKQEETSTSNKQILVVGSSVTNGSPEELSKKERRKLYNRLSAQRSRDRKKTRVNELEGMEKIFNEVKPFVRIILTADTGSFIYQSCLLLRKQLKELINKDPNVARAFGILTSPGSNQTDRMVGVKIGRSPSMVRVASCDRLRKRNLGKQVFSQGSKFL